MKNNSALIFIFVTILVDVIGIGVIIPVLPSLIEQLTGSSTNEAAGYGGLLISSFALMQFICSPLMGELSDRFGRKPILILSLAGLCLDYLLHAYAPTIAWLFVGRLLAGIMGASHTVATAYIADISTKENKAKNFGLVGAAFGLGFIVGPAIGGIFGEENVRLPFYISAVLTFINLIFGLLFVPESLKPENRRKLDLKKAIPGVSLVKIGKYAGLGGLIVAFFLANIAGQSLPATWSFFTIEKFNWTESDVGWSLSAIGLMVALIQGGLVGKMTKWLGMKKVIMLGFVFWTIGMTLFAFAHSGLMIYIYLLPYALGGIASPTLQGLLSNSVSEKEQGNLQGSLTSLMSVSAIIGPSLATYLFYNFANKEADIYFPGAPFLAGSFLLLVSAITVFYALKKLNQNTEVHLDSN